MKITLEFEKKTSTHQYLRTKYYFAIHCQIVKVYHPAIPSYVSLHSEGDRSSLISALFVFVFGFHHFDLSSLLIQSHVFRRWSDVSDMTHIIPVGVS